MFCPKCGASNEADARFCAGCGGELPRTDSGQVPLPPSGIISGSLRDGWEALKRAPGTVGLPPLLYMGMQFALGFGMARTMERSFWPGLALFFFVAMVLLLGYAGYLRALLLVLRRQPVTASDWAEGLTRLPSLLAAGLLTYFAVLGGTILFIIPGIILALGFSQSFYVILDRDPGPVEAMRRSWRMMKGRKLDLFLLQLAIGGICLLASIPFGLGLIVALPWSMAAQVAFYERARNLTGGDAAQAPSPPAGPQ